MALAGRTIGCIAALSAVALWGAFLFRNPYAAPAEGRVLLFGFLMMVAGTVSAVSPALGGPLAEDLLFLVLFFPLGLFVPARPRIFRAVGRVNLAHLPRPIPGHPPF